MTPEEKRAKASANTRAWRAKNKEKCRAYSLARYYKPGEREKRKAYNKRWREENGVEYRARNRARWVSTAKAYREANRDTFREKQLAAFLKKRYGITIEEYRSRLDAQGGACYVCRTPPTSGQRLAVDHCHATGMVRKLLCRQCNAALGMAKETPEILEALAGYIREHRSAAA